eukprot:951758-Prorocentrum_minimum.AAC.1
MDIMRGGVHCRSRRRGRVAHRRSVGGGVRFPLLVVRHDERRHSAPTPLHPRARLGRAHRGLCVRLQRPRRDARTHPPG